MICRTSLVRVSPAANTPARLVRQSSPAWMYPAPSRASCPAKAALSGASPTATNTPESSSRVSSPVVTSRSRAPATFSSPVISSTTLFRCRWMFCRFFTASARMELPRNWSRRWIRWTAAQLLDRKRASSSAVLPPPTMATSAPWKKAPSQVAQ